MSLTAHEQQARSVSKAIGLQFRRGVRKAEPERNAPVCFIAVADRRVSTRVARRHHGHDARDPPDILRFSHAKNDQTTLMNFDIAVPTIWLE